MECPFKVAAGKGGGFGVEVEDKRTTFHGVDPDDAMPSVSACQAESTYCHQDGAYNPNHIIPGPPGQIMTLQPSATAKP